jgi:uncharacterized Tic20 family protein
MASAHNVHPWPIAQVAANVFVWIIKKLPYAAVNVQRANFQNFGLAEVFWKLVLDTGHKNKLLLVTHAKILIYGLDQF